VRLHRARKVLAAIVPETAPALAYVRE